MKLIKPKFLFICLLIVSSFFITESAQSTGEKSDGHSTYYGILDGEWYKFTLNRCAPCSSAIRRALGCRCVESIGREKASLSEI